jgi:RNA polymerase sigma factor (sigma-70 family)
MQQPYQAEPVPEPILDQISTCWHRVHDSAYVAASYERAIRRYLEALLKNTHDAEEVTQDFLLRVHEQGLGRARPERGRFRDYLKKAVRNAALNFLRRQRAPGRSALPLKPEVLADDAGPRAERQWLADWRRSLLERAWQALEIHQHLSPGSLYHTVLRLAVEHPDEDSCALAERASAQAGRAVRPGTFRQQLSRARRLFAGFLTRAVARTLPAGWNLEDELTDLGLMGYVRPHLPDGWRGRGGAAGPE